jgi:hypothetical protein
MRVAVGARESSKQGAVTTGEMQIEQATVEMQATSADSNDIIV